MNKPGDLELEFHRRMHRVYEQARSECGYIATRFLQMIADRGGVQAAKDLLRTEGYSEGLTRLWEEGRLDISMEAAVLEDQWCDLFNEDELATAARRLEELEFSPVTKS